MNVCIYRLIECPKLHCETKVPYHGIFEHIRSDEVFEQEYDLDMTNEILFEKILPNEKLGEVEFDVQFKIYFDENVFVFSAWAEDKRLDCWLQMVGSEYDAKNYYYSLKFHGIDPYASTTFTAQVIPIDETQDSILEKDLQYDIRWKRFKKYYVDKSGKFQISINIRNMKEEAKDEETFESGISDDED